MQRLRHVTQRARGCHGERRPCPEPLVRSHAGSAAAAASRVATSTGAPPHGVHQPAVSAMQFQRVLRAEPVRGQLSHDARFCDLCHRIPRGPQSEGCWPGQGSPHWRAPRAALQPRSSNRAHMRAGRRCRTAAPLDPLLPQWRLSCRSGVVPLQTEPGRQSSTATRHAWHIGDVTSPRRHSAAGDAVQV